MKCPRCQTDLEDGRCPKCAWLPSSELSKKVSRRSSQSQKALGFPVEVHTAPLTPTTQDWRSELREKLKKHYGQQTPRTRRSETEVRTEVDVSPNQAGVKSETPPVEEPGGKSPEPEKERSSPAQSARSAVFDYKMAAPSKIPKPKVVTFKKTSDSLSAENPKEKPLIRPPLKTRVVSKKHSPEQKPLSLESIRKASFRVEEPVVVSGPPTTRVSAEILLSRALASTIDLLVAGGSGLILGWAGARFLEIPFPSVPALWIWLLGGSGFFFLNSVFFLYTIGQTPGMMATGLCLVSQDSDRVLLSSVIARVLVFVPVAVTMLGLFWGFFDAQRRCWHDHLSATKVIHWDETP